jgi:RNA polymerase sigma factor (sigma-70 family)
VLDANDMTLRRIMGEYGGIVTALCRRMIRDEEAARDAAQEAWIEITRGLETYRGEAKLSTWIYTVASHAILRHAKKEKVYTTRFLSGFFHGPQQEIPDEARQEKDHWVRSMCDKCLTGIVHCLDNQARLAYILRDMAELDYGEIAGICGTDEQNIRKIISRSRAKLNKFLSNECALHNPEGKCRCRMKRWVMEINLPDQYSRLRKTLHNVSVFKASSQTLPHYDYWTSLLAS